MAQFSIRPLARTDETLLWEMLYHALHIPPGAPPFPREIIREPHIAKYVAGWGREGDEGFAAIEGANSLPIGAIWIRRFTASDKGYGYFVDDVPELSMAVLPAYRNLGIGTALLTNLIAATAPGYSALSLSVSLTNPAVRLYRRFGFQTVHDDGTSMTMLRKGGPPPSLD